MPGIQFFATLGCREYAFHVRETCCLEMDTLPKISGPAHAAPPASLTKVPLGSSDGNGLQRCVTLTSPGFSFSMHMELSS